MSGRTLRFIPLLGFLMVGPVWAEEPPAVVVIAEFVTDPQHDWDGSGSITGSDEWFELENVGNATVSLAGWTLELIDTTPAVAQLAGDLPPGGRLVVRNPPGEQNNNGRLVLRDANGEIVDEVRHGTWEAGAEGPRAESGDASGPLDEALARDGTDWRKTVATPGQPNFLPLAFLPPPTGLVPWGDGWATNATSLTFTPSVFADPAYGNASVALLLKTPGGAVDRVDANASASTFTVVLAADGAYEASVEARNGRGAATWPDPPLHFLRDATPPVASAFAPPRYANGTVSLSWPAAVDQGVGGVAYRLAASVGNRTSVSPWTDDANATVAVSNDGPTHVRIEARDALGNRATLAAWSMRHDGRPPQSVPAEKVRVAGDREARVSWDEAVDGESYVSAYRLARIGFPGETPRLFDAGNRTSWTDRNLSLGQPAWYQVLAVDAAGNQGPLRDANWTEARLGMHTPRPLSLDVSSSGGSAVTLRIHASFDRAMGGTPLVEFRGEGKFEDVQRTVDGAWDADRRGWTGSARLPALVQSLAGRAWFGGARDDFGNVVPLTASAPFVLDGVPPSTTMPGDFGTWLAAGRLVVALQANDDLDDAPVLEVRVWKEGRAEPRIGETFSRTTRVTLTDDGIHLVKVRAVDAAGNREPWRTLRVGLDATPPTVRLLGPASVDRLGEVEVRLGDATSGLGAGKPKVWLEQAGWRVPGEARWDGDVGVAAFAPASPVSAGAVDVFVDLADRAGNRLSGRIGTIEVRRTQQGGEAAHEASSFEGLPPTEKVHVGDEALAVRNGAPSAEQPESVLGVLAVDPPSDGGAVARGGGAAIPSVGGWLPATGLLLAALLLRRRPG